MPDTAKKLEDARQLLDPILGESRRLTRYALGHADADSVLGGGLARGALHEIFAGDAGASGFTVCAAQRVSGDKHLLWIIQDFCALEHGAPAPTGFAELGIDPSKLLLLRAADAADALRAGVDALSCTGLGAVIMEIAGNPKVLDLVASRRLVAGRPAARRHRFSSAPECGSRTRRRADALADPQQPLRRNGRLGNAALRRRACSQPARRDRTLGDGVEL